MKNGLVAAGAGTATVGVLTNSLRASTQDEPEEKSGRLTRGDASILRFLAAAEILETDLWQQYNELGGIQDSEVPGGSESAPYTAALAVLDSDMAQYIHDNTEDELTHEVFINAYLASKGANTEDGYLVVLKAFGFGRSVHGKLKLGFYRLPAAEARRLRNYLVFPTIFGTGSIRRRRSGIQVSAGRSFGLQLQD